MRPIKPRFHVTLPCGSAGLAHVRLRRLPVGIGAAEEVRRGLARIDITVAQHLADLLEVGPAGNRDGKYGSTTTSSPTSSAWRIVSIILRSTARKNGSWQTSSSGVTNPSTELVSTRIIGRSIFRSCTARQRRLHSAMTDCLACAIQRVANSRILCLPFCVIMSIPKTVSCF